MYKAYFVDDEPHVLDGLVSNPVFLDCGYQVVGSSTNPLKAEKEIIKKSPDVVFIDLRMPKLTGIELMEKLQQKGAVCEFVIISAYGEFEASRSFFKSGGFDYLTKPVWDEDLQAILNRLSDKIDGKVRVPAAVVKTPSPELNEIIAYIKNNLSAKHTLESLGDRFNIHHTYICDLFSNHLDTTFTAYMTRLRMETAAELLKITQKGVKEIAWLCGYDYIYFVQVFKKYHACTPAAYRAGRSPSGELLAQASGAGRSADAELLAQASGEATYEQ